MLRRECRVLGNIKEDSLAVAINRVLTDNKIGDKTKIERIEAYVQVFFDNKEDHL